LLFLAAVLEAATGVALIVSPPVVVRVLLGEDVLGAGMILGRVSGFALLSLGLACWPGTENGGNRTRVQAVRAMLTYNLLVAAYFAYLRVVPGFSGNLLWPAIVLHALLAVLFARALWKEGSEANPRRNA
jgi:hypothetical protein